MRSVLLVGALCVGAATAQDPAASGTFTDRRSGLELKLEAARAQLRRGNSEKAVETYLEIEAELAEVERETPTARPVTQVGPGLDRGLRAYLRELLAELPPEAQDRYRLTTDPKASLALKQALEQDDLDALEALAARYPLSDASLSALSTLGERAFELGDLSRAARAFEALAARSSDPSTARRASWCALLAWATLGEREAAARALAAYVAHGGDPARERAVGARSVRPRAWVESLTPRRGPDALPARFPLGDLDRDTELADPELPRALALRLDALPVYREPVYAPEDDALYLADWKRVARVPAGARGGASWAFAYPEDGDLPSRIEALPNRPAVAGGLVYATLHRNRPATVLVGEDEQRTVERRSDWRVVALGRERGEKVWDAADAEGFARWSQGAEWLSPPLYAHGSLFVVALLQETDLECYLLRIDAHSGELVYAAFVASRARRDYLGLTTAPPPPSWTHDGRVLINPGLGVVACVAPADGDLEWIAHYGTPPPTSVPVLWERQRRFAPQAPLARTTPWIVAPADGSEALAFDPDGRRVWAAPRGQARYAVADAERVYLVGDALAVHERAHGRLLQVSAPDPRLRPSAPPALLGEELVLSTQTELVRRDLASGEVLGRYAYAAPRDELGAPVVLDRAHLATVGSSRVNVYRSFEALSEAVRRESLGVERELRLGVAQVQAGDAAGLERLRRVLADRRTDREQRVRARRAAFVYAEARAWEAERRGEFEARAREALELAWDGPLAQATPPQGTEAQRLAQRSARLLVAWAERRAESPDPAAGAEAAAAFQCLLWLPHSSRVEVPCGIEVDPWGFGEARLRQLVAARGRGIYATQEALARQELQLARSTDDTAQLERLLERFGAAACAADARWELATRYLQRALREEGVATLERFLREWPEDPRVPEAWARLATNYLKLGRRAEARRALRTLMTLSPEPQVKGGQRVALPARAWASPQLAELEEGRDARVLLAEEHLVGLHPALKPWLRTRTELDAEPRGLADVLAFPARPDLVVTQRDQEVELLDTATGQATALYVEEESSLLELGFAGETLVVPTRSAVHGFLLPPGEGIAPRGRWTWAPEAGEASAPAPGEPLDRRGELVYEVRPVGARIVVRISGEVVVLDAADGRELGRIVLPRVQRITARDGVLYALSGGPVEVAAYALDALGAPRWSWTSDERELSGVTWLGSEQLVVLQSGLTLTSLRVDGGSRAWEVESPDDWFLGMQPSPNGKRLLVRTQSGGERGFVILGELGQELWTDRGRAEDGARAALNLTEVGEDAVFSWRTVSGAGELWAQDLERGTLLWRYKPAGGGAQAPDRLLLTPELVAFGLRSAFSQRVDLSVLGRGTGDLQQALRVPGRRLVGAGVAALAGRVWVSTDRGLSAFAHLERTSQAERVARLGARVSTHPDDLDSRRELARALVQGGDTRAAVQVLEATLQAEGLGDEAGQSLLDELAALVEADTDDHPQTLPIRRQARPPEIDGELHDWWRPWSGATLLQPSHVQPIQQPAGAPRGRWRGDEDLSGRLYLSYDTTYLYFALDVSDAVLRPYDTESDAWIGDALLIAIDCKGDGGEFVHDDDMLLSLALTLPKKKKEGEEEEDAEEEEEDDSPAGQYFVRRKEDNSGVIYECAIPWASFRENGVSETDLDPQTGPRPGFRFGFDVIVTDDDGARGPDGPLGALKTLQLAPGVLLHRDKSRLWQGYVPRRFTRLLIQ